MAYKAGNEQSVHQYTISKDEPFFLRARANAAQLSEVSQGVGTVGSAALCLCGHLATKATSYTAVFGSAVVYVAWFLTSALGKRKTNLLAMAGRVLSY